MSDDKLGKAYEAFLEEGGFAYSCFSEVSNAADIVQFVLSQGGDPLKTEDILKKIPERSFVDSSWLENELRVGVNLGWIDKVDGKYAPSEETREMCDDFVLDAYRDSV